MNGDGKHESSAKQRQFATTRWSVVLAAGGGHENAEQALAQLCETYWYPLYAYVRRRVGDVHEAQDLTQAFFLICWRSKRSPKQTASGAVFARFC